MTTEWISSTGRISLTGPRDLHADRPQPARMYDYYLDGETNFAADREAADRVLSVFPAARDFARENRGFLRRAVTTLAEAGADQFLDIGSGIPTSPNTHELAQSAAPAAHIVYADHDPLVLAHARDLMSSTPQGRVDYIRADLRAPETVLTHPCLVGGDRALDLSRPVVLLLVAVLHFFEDSAEPYALVRKLTDALPSGSHLVLSHITADLDPEGIAGAGEVYQASKIPGQARGLAEVSRFAEGWELLEPGVVPVDRWRAAGAGRPVSCYGLVARKP
ncbi:SAM-dependent methyltransferase [Phaeacidiphilus oryzae]|uniref:SAM-dependent methyltransferase n=1 Tax=Phaeacidiphilus oryzae TaxID=348818 RepID=UPI000564B4D4|nr:SAM-dependent methyltransferase [Phaeacidiphilus oryzae]